MKHVFQLWYLLIAEGSAVRLHGYEATPFYGYASCGPAEFGGKIEFPYKEGAGAPYIQEHPVNRIEDIERLEVPDFKKALPGCYAQADIVAERSRALGMPARTAPMDLSLPRV